jgi:hypothetical protein
LLSWFLLLRHPFCNAKCSSIFLSSRTLFVSPLPLFPLSILPSPQKPPFDTE